DEVAGIEVRGLRTVDKGALRGLPLLGNRNAKHQVVVVEQAMVEAEIALGAIELAGRGREEIPRRGFLAADIGQRDQLLHFQYRRVEAAGGDRLVGERLGGNDARDGVEATA